MKRLYFVLLCVMTFSFTSCLSLCLIPQEADHTVYVNETTTQVHQRIEGYQKRGEYLKKFRSIDKAEKFHEVVIYDRQYFSIDGVIFAYDFRDAMWYGLALTLPGGSVHTVEGTDKIIGYSGYATCIDNPETTVSFIFAQKLFCQRGYANRSEAVKNVKGASFYGLGYNQGYVDDFGKYRKYDYWDFFDEVFKTSKKDVRTLMYSAVSIGV